MATISSSSEAPARPVSSGRRGSKKVRTGCITCKIRKVKCDETKPFCIRCSKTGRTCDGYLDPSALASRRRLKDNTHHHHFLSPLIGSSTPEETRSFHFFQNVTAPCISEGFDAIFWRTVVLQISQTEPAVRHAVLAVSSLHEALTTVSLPGGATQSFALQQYNKAIAHVLYQMNYPGTRLLVSLLTCVLFVCIEFLQGKDKESLIHLEQGRQLLARLDQRPNAPEMECIVRYIVPLYTRLNLRSFLFGGTPVPIPHSQRSRSEVPATFESIDGLRASMRDFMEQAFHFAERARPAKNTSDPIPGDMMKVLEEEQDRLLSRLSRLNVTFSLFRASRSKPDQENTLLVLQSYLHAQHIWISTALSSSEVVYDDYLSNFAAIVPLAAAYLDLEVSPQHQSRPASWPAVPPIMPSQYLPRLGIHHVDGQLSNLTYETHIIPPLYYVATKCRHPLIRGSALNLLRRNPFRHESLWRASVMGSLAGHIVSLEERWAQGHALPATPGPTCTPRGRHISLDGVYYTAQPTTIIESQHLRMDGLSRDMPLDTMFMPTEEPPAGLPLTSTVTPITELDFEDFNSDEYMDYVIDKALHTDLKTPPSFSQPPSLTSSSNRRSSNSVMDSAADSLSRPINELPARQQPEYQQQSYRQDGPYVPASDMRILSTSSYSCAPGQVQQLMPITEQPGATTGCASHTRSGRSSPDDAYEQCCYHFTSEGHAYSQCRHQTAALPAAPPSPPRQQARLTGGHTPENVVTDAPFGLPEELRVHDDATAGREREDGSWVAVFRRLQGVDAGWDVPAGWAPAGDPR